MAPVDHVSSSLSAGAGSRPRCGAKPTRPYNRSRLALSPGTRLGVYEVTAQIGEGGMGQVFLARDTRLNRDVALKVLPDSFADDPDRMARFTREAQTLAALNHPNIAHVHGLEESGGVRALAMELVEGDDLSQRIARGPIPLDEVLPIAKQIADALEAAHDQGIVHRDLKPANIKVCPDGTVKVLDFGLAKSVGPVAGSDAAAALANSPTLTNSPLTARGVILGTAAYMSPEQAAGKVVDKRSDLWAFGVVLLEMLTGRAVFTGPDATHVVAAVLKSEPDWTTLPAETPEALRRLLRRCLVKDRKRRLDSAAGARLEIEEALIAPSTSDGLGPLQGSATRSAWRRALPWAVAAVFGVALVSALVVWSPWRSTSGPTTRITLSLSRDNALTVGSGAAISPDGRTLAFVARSSEGAGLYLRGLDEWEPRPLPQTNGAALPFFSPDGRWIAFSRGGNLEKMPVSGGPSQVICKVTGPYGGRWMNDGTIIFGDWPNVGLWRVSPDGGTPQLITRPSEGTSVRYFWPEPLPADRGILFTIFQEGRASVAVLARGSDTPRILVESGSQARYVPTGHLVYIADSHLLAVPFDVDRLEVRGGATVVVDDINETGLTPYGISDNGVLVYQTGESLASNIVWKDRQGTTVPIGLPRRQYQYPALSRDGQRLSVVVLEGPTRNIWTGRVANEPLTRLTFGNDDIYGSWSGDGERLFYTPGQNGKYNIFSIPTNGTGKREQLTQGPNPQWPTSVSPSGDTLFFDEIDPSTGRDIWELSISKKEPRPLVNTRFEERGGGLSSDQRWLAYQSNESGRAEVYVQAYPGPGVRRRVSSDGGTAPFWSRTGRELYYSTATAMFALPILDAGDLRLGPPVRLFTLTTLEVPAKATSADDQRFLMLQANPSSQLNLVQNWFGELRRLAPNR